MGGLPDTVRMERTETGPVYACGACGFRTGEAEMVAPDGAGHAGGNGRCRACEGEVAETVEPDVPVLWPDAGTEGDRGDDRADDLDGDRGDGGDGLEELAEKVRQYIERERLAEEEVTVARVAGGLLESPERVREVLQRGV
jgi:hypothetical protein